MRQVYSVAAAMLIPALLGTGCAGLDTSARAEGSGIQVIGAIVVLAKYQASQKQKTAAETHARQAFVERALQPAYQARAKKLRSLAAASPRPKRARSGTTPATPSAPDPSAQATAELAALSASWKETAARFTGGGDYATDFAVPGLGQQTTTAVSFPKLSESEVLAASAAYVPRYLAVAVPAEQAVPGSKEAVMLWDTRTHRLASDTVYALDRTPPESKRTKIDGLVVQFETPDRPRVD